MHMYADSNNVGKRLPRYIVKENKARLFHIKEKKYIHMYVDGNEYICNTTYMFVTIVKCSLGHSWGQYATLSHFLIKFLPFLKFC
jgi:hypothetical protein